MFLNILGSVKKMARLILVPYTTQPIGNLTKKAFTSPCLTLLTQEGKNSEIKFFLLYRLASFYRVKKSEPLCAWGGVHKLRFQEKGGTLMQFYDSRLPVL